MILSDGPMDLSVIWDKPRDRTFPYDPEQHGYGDWGDDVNPRLPMTMIGLLRGVHFMSIHDFGNDIKAKYSTSAKFEGTNYQSSLLGLKVLYSKM